MMAALSGVSWIAALIANMAGSFTDAATRDTLDAFFFETQFGPVVIARLILLAAACSPSRCRGVSALAPGSPSARASSSIKPGSATPPNGGDSPFGAAMIVIYAAHVLAGAAWVGGLPVLCFLLARRDSARGPCDIVMILSRYSVLATGAVTLIIASGIANALFRVQGHFARLVATDYGEILLVKVLLVGIMLALAIYNRFIALPRLETAPQTPDFAGLFRSIGVELALGVLVIGAAALLGVTPPPA